MISIVACCHSAKLCAHAALAFRSQQYPDFIHTLYNRLTDGLQFSADDLGQFGDGDRKCVI